jgi:hypothetical protein
MKMEIRVSSTNGRYGFLINHPKGVQLPVRGKLIIKKSGTFELFVVEPDPNSETWIGYFGKERYDGGFSPAVPLFDDELVKVYDLQSHTKGGIYALRPGAVVQVSGYKRRWTSYCVIQEDGSLKEVTVQVAEEEAARRKAILEEAKARESREVTPRLRILKHKDPEAHCWTETVFYGDFASAFEPKASNATAVKMTGDVIYVVPVELFAALPDRWDMVCKGSNENSYITRPNLSEAQRAIIAAAFKNYNQPYAPTTVVVRGDKLVETKEAQAIELPPIGEPSGELRSYLTGGNHVSAALLHERLWKAGYMLAYVKTVALDNKSERHALVYVPKADTDKIGIWGARFIDASLQFRIGICPGDQFFFFVMKYEAGKTVWITDSTYPKASVPPEAEEVSSVDQRNAVSAASTPKTPWWKAPVVTHQFCKNVNAELMRIFGAIGYGRFELVKRSTGDFGFIKCGTETYFVAPGTLGDLYGGETALVLKAEKSRYADRKPQAIEHMVVTPQMAEIFIP